MKLPRPLLAAVIAVSAAAVLAPAGAHAQTAALQPRLIAVAPTTTAAWTFTTAAWTPRVTAAPATVGDSIAFDVNAVPLAPAQVTQMSFQIMGSLQPGDVSSFELVYYPNGLANPGVVVATNSGASFAHGAKSDILSFDLTAPISVAGAYTGSFALRANVNGARKYSFQPRLQTVVINDGAGPRFVVESETLPMNGDTYFVN